MNYEDLKKGWNTAFYDQKESSDPFQRPSFLSNDSHKGTKVFASIEEELKHCDSFMISVAFITESGVNILQQTLKELEKRNIPGKILTTDYLTFSEPKALKVLHDLKNIELRMYTTAGRSNEGFHTKGYIFHHQDSYHFIIGSSNLTQKAISENKEWNSKIISTSNGEFASNLLDEFDSLWNSDKTETYDQFIDSYTHLYQLMKSQRKLQQDLYQKDLDLSKLKPNSMQLGFIEALNTLKQQGEKKALLISATGTGKTYASAFAMKQEKQKKVLFAVHREQIAKQALESYQKVFGNTVTYGLLSGTRKDYDADYLFSTIQTLSQDDVLTKFAKDHFDTIIIDETHRAGAPSYQKLFNYFTPELWLGMTATPERTDDYDIFSAFDHNIAYEIRLQQALEDNLLCPFHYFGITDLTIDGISSSDDDLKDFNFLVSDQRVDYILEQAEYYGYSGDRVKGLVFCSRIEIAKDLSMKFNERGYHTVALTGSDSQTRREECIQKLITDDAAHLDYIFTVDTFNEGIDIPEVNQILMLRPTQSPIIFTQQLGRGLRKTEDKEYVVIIDFIGNYTNNYMIPIALSGDRSYNKDNLRRYLSEGDRIISGCSCIHFDEISRDRIFHSIDNARTNSMQLIRKAYTDLKYKLGKIPCLMDFSKYGTMDVTKIFDKCGSYYAFLKENEEDYTIRFSKEEESILKFVSQKIAKGKRIDELVILKALILPETIPSNNDLITYCKEVLLHDYHITCKDEEIQSAIRNLTNAFVKDSVQKTQESCIFLDINQGIQVKIDPIFQTKLNHHDFSAALLELIDFGMDQYDQYYSNRYKDTAFQLYQKYTYEDVCLLMNWNKDLTAQNIGGYFYDKKTKTLPVFINYDKSEDAIAYEDRFLSNDTLIALSKHPRKITSSDADHIYRRTKEDEQNRIFLFIRKNKDDKEAKEFYFLGEMNPKDDPKPITLEASKDSAFEIHYQLDNPIKEDIFDYITNKTISV